MLFLIETELLDPDYSSNLLLKLANKIFAYTIKGQLINPRLRDKVEIVTAGVDRYFQTNLQGGKEIRYKISYDWEKFRNDRACGKPVVASDVEIIRDIIGEKNCGLLAKPGNAGDFAEKIRMLLEDDSLRKKLCENDRKAVIEKYTWDKAGEDILGCENRK